MQFRGHGICSHNIVFKAKEEQIKWWSLSNEDSDIIKRIDFKIIKVMYASRVLPKDYITEKINKIDECLKNDVALKKIKKYVSWEHGKNKP